MNKLSFSRPVYIAILLSLGALLVAGPALAQNSSAPGRNELSASPQPQGSGPTDPAELEAFLDEFMAAQTEKHHVAGATVAVVKDGELFFTKGYGYADLENGTPVDPYQTLFNIGSASKIFVWTAVMQLAEQGKVDLNTDVNTYLKKDVQIPATFPEPITLAHLMTHTDGFEELLTGIFPHEIESVPPVDVLIYEGGVARVRPPGTSPGYANYGTALAAYIVQEVSGVPFEQYVEDNIYDPLGMARSTFRQPVPPGLADDLAVGYSYDQGEYRPHHVEWIRMAPAGAMQTTASDMARFMIAHLQDGRYEETRILQEATAQEMHSLQFSKHPQASGWTYGFVWTVVNGERIIWHKGGTLVFNASMILLPERDIGLFVSYNTPAGFRELMEAFVDHYYPAPPAPPVPQSITDSDAHLDRFVGSYRGTRLNETGLESYMALVKTVSVKSSPNGTLQSGQWTGYDPGQVLQWAATEDPLVFSQIDGRDTLVFLEDMDGNITSFLSENWPLEEFFKLDSWFETTIFHLLWLLVCLIFLLVNVFFWPVWFLKHKRATREGVSLTTRLAIWVSWGVAALGLVFIVGFGITMVGPQLAFGPPPAGLLLIPLIMTVLTIAMVILAIVTWLRREWSLGMRIYYALVTVASVALIWWLYNWNLLVWKF